MERDFTADEDCEKLRSNLTLPEPKRLENGRERIEAQLPTFDGPTVGD